MGKNVTGWNKGDFVVSNLGGTPATTPSATTPPATQAAPATTAAPAPAETQATQPQTPDNTPVE